MAGPAFAFAFGLGRLGKMGWESRPPLIEIRFRRDYHQAYTQAGAFALAVS